MASMVSRGRGRRTINEINMVPFIDVMLVLLIIFMVTAPLITPSVIDLPSVANAGKQPDQIIQIVIGKDDAIEMKIKEKTTPLALANLANAVKAAQSTSPNSAVLISADKKITYESVMKVMDALKKAEINRIGLSVQLSN
jgi:biopolymer transport protein TolR